MIAIQIPRIEYQTITHTRRLSVDMPFANPHKGAPYGEKNGPALGVAAAIGSISAGMAATSTLLGGIMIAGGIASGLGAITGNKTLSTIGAVAGLAGFGVGAFTGVEGGFLNPFSTAADGTSNFFNTVSGDAVKSVFSNIKSGLGIGDSAMVSGIKDTAGIASNAADTAGGLMSAGTEQLGFVDGVSTSALGRATDAVSSGASGLLGSLNSNSGAINALGGLSEGYMKGKEIEQLQPLTDAKVDLTNSQTAAQQQQMDLIKQRQQNLQFQPNSAATVNQDQNVYNRQPGTNTPGKIAVSIEGEIKYVSPEEYNQIQQAKSGAGMLSQMGGA
ncbi:MAG: hypothetical protein CTY14_02175 [Methylotenera sp.]|nr:MAG: hypothetical protein CTY14_02175 [Methylotenera sp.]